MMRLGVLGLCLGALVACGTIPASDRQKSGDCFQICGEMLGSRMTAARRIPCVREPWITENGECAVEICQCRCYALQADW